MAVQVAALPGGFEPGRPVVWSACSSDESSGGGAAFPGQESVCLDGSRAAPWSGRLADTGAGLPGSGAGRRRLREVLRETLAAEGSSSSFRGLVLGRDENPFARRARRIVDDAFPAAAGAPGPPTPRWSALLSGLCGLGAGFTPSGDDFLAGVLLGEAMANRPLEEDAAAQEGFVTEVPAGTTPAGRTLLWLALQRRFPAYLLSLAVAAIDPGSAELNRALAAAFSHGATSGQDAVSGFLRYLDHVDSLTAS